MSEFISEDDLLTFDGWLRYQAVPETSTPEELQQWRAIFEDLQRARDGIPKLGRMKLPPATAGEERYGVAIRDEAELWLTMWARCAPKGDIYLFYPRADRSNPHASYHHNGRFHQKSYGVAYQTGRRQLQPLSGAFRGSEHFGSYAGHGKSTGAICDPEDFDGVVVVESGILGPIHGSVVVDIVQPGHQPKYDPDVFQRQIFRRGNRPSIVITISRHDQVPPFLHWPEDFESACPKAAQEHPGKARSGS